MTSLAMERVLVKIIFGRKIFICQPNFKIFVALFNLRSHFAGGVSEQGDMKKGSFQKMV